MRTLIFASLLLSAHSCESCVPTGSGSGGGGTAVTSRAGDYAYDYLRSDTYTSVLVEIDYIAGRPPSGLALDALEEALVTYLDKPDGISLLVDDEIPLSESPGAWSPQDIRALEEQYRDHHRDPATGEMVLYFVYLDGHSVYDDGEGRVLGHTLSGSSLAMFKDTILDRGGPPFVVEQVEPKVIVHELGHVLGLVDNGLPMQTDRLDHQHGKHDLDPDCLMHWTVSSDRVVDVIQGNASTEFCSHCEDDMAAARGE